MKEKMIKKQPIADSRQPLAKLITANRLPLTAKKGFTMVEMLVAIVVLALGIMSVSAIFPLSLRVAQRMKAITKGTAYAHQKLDELRTIPYNDADLSAGTHPSDTLENEFIREYTVDDSIPMVGMKRIEVKVNWIHPDTDSVVIYTYLTRN